MEASVIKELKPSRVGDNFILVPLGYCSGKYGIFYVVGVGGLALEIKTIG